MTSTTRCLFHKNIQNIRCLCKQQRIFDNSWFMTNIALLVLWQAHLDMVTRNDIICDFESLQTDPHDLDPKGKMLAPTKLF